ncbi:MAG TPA: helix-hairpin-helix domain-containing protein, partial [Streptosporangiaceae bacterium]|nr:helix-hairpin-helix domain-containing protein [Streptosporangiaceae bacterium]
MAWLNEVVAGLLAEYAELIQITGGDVFRARNYEKAARSVRGWGEDIGPLDVKALRAIPAVGASIAAKIAEYRDTGSIKALDELRAKIPPGVLELTRVPGLGPKRALQLNHDLGVASVDELAAAIKAGRLEGLAGFGAKSEERIASGIEVYRQGRERVLLDVALPTATTTVAALSAVPEPAAEPPHRVGHVRVDRGVRVVADVDPAPAAQQDVFPVAERAEPGPPVEHPRQRDHAGAGAGQRVALLVALGDPQRDGRVEDLVPVERVDVDDGRAPRRDDVL